MISFSNKTYDKTLLQYTIDDGYFQNFKFNYTERVKTTICNIAVIWTNKVIECIKSRSKDDSRKDIIQAAYKVLNFWTVMEETPKENTSGSGSEKKHDEQNSDNGNSKQSCDRNEEQSDHDDGKHSGNDNANDVNSDGN